MPAVDEIGFLFVVEDAEGDRTEQKVAIAKPVLDAARSTWICELRWDGPVSRRMNIYGATGFQSLSLAIGLVETELAAAFRGRTITESGAPWFDVRET